MAKSYFAILEITSNATADEVHSAYRRLAKRFHPDHYQGGSERFQQIHKAYAVLSDPVRRRAHEKTLSNVPVRKAPDIRPNAQPEPLIPQSGPVDRGAISPVRSFETSSPSFDQLSDRLWNHHSRAEGSKSGRVRHLTLEIPLTREQAILGGTAQLMVPAQFVCPRCRGYGHIGYYECHRCAGEGAISDEVPLSVAFPQGLMKNHAVVIPLERFGIANLHLTVQFRPRDGD